MALAGQWEPTTEDLTGTAGHYAQLQPFPTSGSQLAMNSWAITVAFRQVQFTHVYMWEVGPLSPAANLGNGETLELLGFRATKNPRQEHLVPVGDLSKTCARGDLNPHALSDTGT